MMFAALLWFATLAPCRAISLQTASFRTRWRTELKVRDIRLAGSVLIIQNLWGVSAVDARSGKTLWSYHLKNDSRPLAEYAILPDRVAVVDYHDVVFLDLQRGHELHRTHMQSFVRSLTGPPLVALTDNGRRIGSTLISLNPDGSIAGRRTVRRVHDIILHGDVAVVTLYPNPTDVWPTSQRLAGFDAQTLAPLWQVGGESIQLQDIGGRPHIIETPWGEHPRPIDTRTGELGPPIPTRDGRDEIWAGATWEFETVTSGRGAHNAYDICERARRNDPITGRSRWEIDLPFGVIVTLHDGNTFYMAGSSDASHHFLVAVDWSSGRLMGAWSGLPDFHTIVKFDDRIIGGTFEELDALQLSRD